MTKLREAEYRDSIELPSSAWNVCRECRHLQNCIVLRGWNVCLRCLEVLDQTFCEQRNDKFFSKRREPSTILSATFDLIAKQWQLVYEHFDKSIGKTLIWFCKSDADLLDNRSPADLIRDGQYDLLKKHIAGCLMYWTSRA